MATPPLTANYWLDSQTLEIVGTAEDSDGVYKSLRCSEENARVVLELELGYMANHIKIEVWANPHKSTTERVI